MALAAAVLSGAANAALAHAFLDHASPAVGSTLPAAPPAVMLWFSQELEPAFSTVTVTDKAGNRVDRGDGAVDPKDPTELHATLKPLPPGSYKVIWRVVSVDTHTTEGDFGFVVGGR
jgi:methionine-rich copper-binding protein CopC